MKRDEDPLGTTSWSMQHVGPNNCQRHEAATVLDLAWPARHVSDLLQREVLRHSYEETQLSPMHVSCVLLRQGLSVAWWMGKSLLQWQIPRRSTVGPCRYTRASLCHMSLFWKCYYKREGGLIDPTHWISAFCAMCLMLQDLLKQRAVLVPGLLVEVVCVSTEVEHAKLQCLVSLQWFRLGHESTQPRHRDYLRYVGAYKDSPSFSVYIYICIHI